MPTLEAGAHSRRFGLSVVRGTEEKRLVAQADRGW